MISSLAQGGMIKLIHVYRFSSPCLPRRPESGIARRLQSKLISVDKLGRYFLMVIWILTCDQDLKMESSEGIKRGNERRGIPARVAPVTKVRRRRKLLSRQRKRRGSMVQRDRIRFP